MRLLMISAAIALTACGPKTDTDQYLVRACGDGTRIYMDGETKQLVFSSALAAGKVAPNLTADQVCNGIMGK